jgi:hypothetical protein
MNADKASLLFLQSSRNDVGETETAVLGEHGSELLFGVVRGAFARGIFAAQPTTPAFSNTAEHLRDQ